MPTSAIRCLSAVHGVWLMIQQLRPAATTRRSLRAPYVARTSGPGRGGSTVRRSSVARSELSVALHQKIHASAQPVQVGALRHTGEGPAVKLARRRFRESSADCCAHAMLPLLAGSGGAAALRAAGAAHAAVPESLPSMPVGAIGVTERVSQDDVRFPSHRSPSISLPYAPTSPMRLRTSSVIWNATPSRKPKRSNRSRLLVVGVGDQRADAHRVDEAVPGGLLEHEPQVVVGPDGQIVVAHPAKLRGLPFQAFQSM